MEHVMLSGILKNKHSVPGTTNGLFSSAAFIGSPSKSKNCRRVELSNCLISRRALLLLSFSRRLCLTQCN